ncbi:MAG TPA: hypothetical protein VHU92_24510 [Streptosporangiaceae bacterium]|nr:hypothetical protein [Streptosporangiaceae bacterium]
MTETRTRDHASGPGGGPDPGRANRDGRASALNVRITPGGYLLAAFAAAVSGLSLAGTAPGQGSAAYLAAGVAVAILLVGSALGIDRLPVLILGYAALANAALGVLSLLPGTGPDGGRIVRALTWARTGNPAKADLVAARAGQVTGVALVAAGLILFAAPGYLAGLWLALIGLLASGASRARARRSLVTTAQLGAPRPRSAWAR